MLGSSGNPERTIQGPGAGLGAGAVAAAIYALHCTELAPPFIGIWYLLGMLIPTGLGAFAAGRFLHW